MSGNPFRRQRLPDETTQHEANGDVPETKPKTKKKKKVVIQTPPHSPDEPKASIPRRLSDGLTGSPPAPMIRHLEDDESDSTTTTADSDFEHKSFNTSRNTGPPPVSFGGQSGSRALYNPFAKTLATSEAVYGRKAEEELSEERQEVNGVSQRGQATSRPALDVDTFKNILLTGSATPSPPNGGTASQRPQVSSSNTDTSSSTKQTMFDTMGFHPESPRTSFDDHYGLDDDGSGDDERSSLMGPLSSRPVEEGPPAPPKPKHGRAFPQTVSFADFDETIPSTDMLTPTRLQTSALNMNPLDKATGPRSPSDLNKPLPPPPAGRTNADEVSTSAPSSLANGFGAPTDEVEPTNAAKKAPPPPPTARRRAQPESAAGRVRSDSNLSKSSAQAIESNTSPESQAHKALAPPPPPSRRVHPVQSPAVETSPVPASPSPTPSAAKLMPPPPPRRMPSQRGSSANRTPSNASRVSLPRSDSFTTTAAPGSAPPAPPPRRTAGSKRDSLENGPSNSLSNRRPSHETRRSSGQSFGSDRAHSLHSLQQVHEPEEGEKLSSAAGEVRSAQPDYLADLDAFQKEIDALRAQAARNG